MAFAHTCKKFILTCTVSVFWLQYSMSHDIVPSSPRRTNLRTNLTRKHIKRFQSTLRRRNLKTNLTRKHIKCFQSTLRRTNLKTNLTRKPGAIIGDGDRMSWDARGSMIWDNFSIFRTNCAILTSYICANPGTCRGFSRGCCHVAWSKMVRVARFHSDGRE